jgi:glutamyl-tRNA(Gln) amidotransferase subunit D
MHSSRRDAFQSINKLPVGRVAEEVEFFENFAKRGEGKVRVNDQIESNVALVKVYPGMRREDLDYYVENYRGLVIEGTGLGHLPEDLLPAVELARERGVPIIMNTQTIYGRVDMKVYATGRHLLELGVIPGGDMLPETSYVKLMHVLGNTKNIEEVKRLMEKNLAGELSNVSRADAFQQ